MTTAAHALPATPSRSIRAHLARWLRVAGLLFGACGSLVAAAAEDDAAQAEAGYLKLHPDFVVNLQAEGNKQRYLLATVQVMSHDADTLARTKNHIPALRHRLLLLFSDQHYPEVNTADGQRALQALALTEVNDFVREELGKAHELEGLYFTNFVVE